MLILVFRQLIVSGIAHVALFKRKMRSDRLVEIAEERRHC